MHAFQKVITVNIYICLYNYLIHIFKYYVWIKNNNFLKLIFAQLLISDQNKLNLYKIKKIIKYNHVYIYESYNSLL